LSEGGFGSGNGTNRIPHASLLEKWLFITVSFLPPERVMPVPVGAIAAPPKAGAFALLLFVNVLSISTQHECVCVIFEIPLCGHAPFCGAGGSPFSWVLVSKPSWLLSNLEWVITIAPPELVPEYPSALNSIHACEIVMSHSCLHAPTYIPESFWLLA